MQRARAAEARAAVGAREERAGSLAAERHDVRGRRARADDEGGGDEPGDERLGAIPPAPEEPEPGGCRRENRRRDEQAAVADEDEPDPVRAREVDAEHTGTRVHTREAVELVAVRVVPGR